MVDKTTFSLETEQGKRLIQINPVIGDETDNHGTITGVYQLSEDDTPLGDIIISISQDDWIYTRPEELNNDEVAKLVEFILSQFTAAEDKLDSFPFDEVIAGVIHSFRITHNWGKYTVEKDGIIVAVLEFSQKWNQLLGEPLSGEIFDKLTERIEVHDSYARKSI